MTLPTVPVRVSVYDQGGQPVATGRVTARLDRTDYMDGFVIAPETIDGLTDQAGLCVLNLWPNELGTTGSLYKVVAYNPDDQNRRYLNVQIAVPNSACQLEHILQQQPYPPIDAAQAALQAVQSALAGVTEQAQIAAGQAGLATDSADASAADRVQTGLDAQATAADREQTGIDLQATAADRVQTGLDRQATAADRLQTGLDRAAIASAETNTALDAKATAEDRTQTNLDRQATAADRLQTGLDAQATDADRVQTGLDRQAAAADRLQTGLDAQATDADREQTGLDRQATAADRLQTGLDAQATAADREQTGLDAQATASDRIQTGLDAQATGDDRVQTGLDRQSAANSATAAAESSGAASIQAIVSATKAGESGASAVTANTKAGEASGYAAQALAIYGSAAAQQTAVAQAAAQASLAAGYAASASSVVQQDLSGVTAAALHRSPNAVTAMFIYDTGKDSDGGAWTEKCQHTSWYNEPLNGKWLGAHRNEASARAQNGTLGAELIVGGDCTSATNNFSDATTDFVFDGSGVGSKTSTAGSAAIQSNTLLTVNKVYRLSIDVAVSAGSTGAISLRNTTDGAINLFAGTNVVYFTANNVQFLIIADSWWLGTIDNISVREVTALTTASGDYYQLSTDGKFYKLNATSGTTEVFRGNKRDFPRLSAIVAEPSNVTIYDLTEPGRPMWMRFFGDTAAIPYSNSIACLGNALNGIITIGGVSNTGLYTVTFPADRMHFRYSYSTSLCGTKIVGGISRRNSTLKTGDQVNGTGLIHQTVNAIAMTVLPDAPIDPVTGLKVPTIAVATGGGVSVIKHNGTVVNSISTLSFNQVYIDQFKLYANSRNWGGYFHAGNPGQLTSPFSMATTYPKSWYPDTTNMDVLRRPQRGSLFNKLTERAGVAIMKAREDLPNFGVAAAITNNYNTGHMVGDIRRAYMADVDAGSVSAPELVTNGDFSSGGTGWTAPANWTFANNRAEKVSGSDGELTQSIAAVTGKIYRVSWDQQTAGSFVLRFGGSAGNSAITSGTGSKVWIGSITGASTIRFEQSGTSAGDWIDNVSVKEVIADRSYKANAASITGTLTKTEVASAAELVAYSGFSTSNYLREPYSADLDFGGEWSASAWVNDNHGTAVSSAYAGFTPVSANLVTNGTFDTDTAGWSQLANTSLSVENGALRIQEISSGEGTAILSGFSTVVGKTYRVELDRVLGPAGAVILGGVRRGLGGISGDHKVVYITATDTSGLRIGTDSGTGSAAIVVDNITLHEVGPALITDRAYTTRPKISFGITGTGLFTATAFDGTTTRTVTTSAAYNTATWTKAEACYTTDGTLSIRVGGVEVAATRGNPLLTLNNSNAVLTIGNSFALDAPFPGSIALLKFSATVPTPEQSVWMYEQEKQMFREGSQVCLPDSGAIVDLTYDDATDKWIAVGATNESEWSGLVRTSVTPVPSGSYTKAVATSGVQLLARSTTNPGVDITIPAYGLREELVKRAESAARLNAQLSTYDYVGGFTANTTTGSTAITNVAGLSYPASSIGARVSGAGIPANATIVAISGTTAYLSAAATATATGAQISFVDFILPVGMEAKAVALAGAVQREGATAQFTRLFDGFKEAIRFGTAPAYTANIQIQATRSAA